MTQNAKELYIERWAQWLHVDPANRHIALRTKDENGTGVEYILVGVEQDGNTKDVVRSGKVRHTLTDARRSTKRIYEQLRSFQTPGWVVGQSLETW
jgi:hypothetical protein